MPNLVTLQGQFAVMVSLLVLHARQLGHVLTYGDAYRPPEATWGHPDSLHKMRLAVDFNLFIDGKYQTESEAYLPLGEYWESIGGSWGGRFKDENGDPDPDGNHFSLAYGGMK